MDVLLVDDPLIAGAVATLAGHQQGLLTQAQLRQRGITRAVARHRVRARRWRTPTWTIVDVGLLSPSDLPPSQRSRRAAILGLLAFGPGAIAVGLSALALHGVWGVPPTAPPQVMVANGSDRRRRDGMTVRRFGNREPVVLRDGWPVASVVDAFVQALGEVGPRTALGLLDSAIHRRLITSDELTSLRLLMRGRRGSVALHHVWDLVDGRRESPLESWAYYDLWQAGLVPTDIQIEFRDSGGNVLARADIGFQFEDGSWHLLELDGREFHPPERGPQEDERDNTLTLVALTLNLRTSTVRYRGRHLGPHGRLVRETREALQTHSWRAPAVQAA